MTTIQARRRLIVVVLLGLAVVGAGMRQLADRSSLAYDLGTLLMVLWIPAAGSILGYLLKKWAPPRPPAAFAPGSAFASHGLAEVQLDRGEPPAAPNELACTLVRETEGFTARLRAAEGPVAAPGAPRRVALEFLVPAVAAPRFPPGAEFRVLVGTRVVGHGRILAPAAG